MKKAKRAALESKGWRLGTAQDFLNLTDEEVALIEVKLALSQELRECRAARHLSQSGLAKLIGSSQSRVAKMESGDRSVTVDLLMKSLFTLGVTPKDVGGALQRRRQRVAV
jgi:predicted transcriptional regulator